MKDPMDAKTWPEFARLEKALTDDLRRRWMEKWARDFQTQKDMAAALDWDRGAMCRAARNVQARLPVGTGGLPKKKPTGRPPASSLPPKPAVVDVPKEKPLTMADYAARENKAMRKVGRHF